MKNKRIGIFIITVYTLVLSEAGSLCIRPQKTVYCLIKNTKIESPEINIKYQPINQVQSSTIVSSATISTMTPNYTV